MINEECPRHSRREDWNHVIQCPHTLDLKVDFIIEIKSKLLKVKYEDATNEEIEEIIRDAKYSLKRCKIMIGV